MTRNAPQIRARIGPGTSTATRAPSTAPPTPPPPIHIAGPSSTLAPRIGVNPAPTPVATKAPGEIPRPPAGAMHRPAVTPATQPRPPPIPLVPLPPGCGPGDLAGRHRADR